MNKGGNREETEVIQRQRDTERDIQRERTIQREAGAEGGCNTKLHNIDLIQNVTTCRMHEYM